MNKSIGSVLALNLACLTLCMPTYAQTKQAVAPQNQMSTSQTDPVHEIRPPAVPEEFIIGTSDVLAVNVWKEAEISKVVPVRSDGRISLPLIGEVQAGGQTPRQLEAEISRRLKEFVSDPEVTVVVQEIRSQKINVLGMVGHPGSFPLIKPMTVIDAIATAGGFRDFAKQKDVYVLRRDSSGREIRLPFNYKEVIKGQHPEQNVELQTNDTVVVP